MITLLRREAHSCKGEEMNASSEDRTLPAVRGMPAARFPGYLVGREEQDEIHLGYKEEITAHSYQSAALLHIPHALSWQWKPSLSADPEHSPENRA